MGGLESPGESPADPEGSPERQTEQDAAGDEQREAGGDVRRGAEDYGGAGTSGPGRGEVLRTAVLRAGFVAARTSAKVTWRRSGEPGQVLQSRSRSARDSQSTVHGPPAIVTRCEPLIS